MRLIEGFDKTYFIVTATKLKELRRLGLPYYELGDGYRLILIPIIFSEDVNEEIRTFNVNRWKMKDLKIKLPEHTGLVLRSRSTEMDRG